MSADHLLALLEHATAECVQFTLIGAEIPEAVHLRDKTWATSIRFIDCCFQGGIDAACGTFSSVVLERCTVDCLTDKDPLDAGRQLFAFKGALLTASSLSMKETTLKGRCDLHSSTIKSDLEGSGLIIDLPAARPAGWLLDLTNASVGSDLSLKGANCGGSVSIAGATIGGQVNMRGATLGWLEEPAAPRSGSIPDYTAFWGQGCTVKESILADAGSLFSGYVSFQQATVTQNLDLRGATFVLPACPFHDRPSFGQDRKRIAVDFYNTTVGNSLILTGTSVVPGRVKPQIDFRYCTTKRLVIDTEDTSCLYGVRGLTYVEFLGGTGCLHPGFRGHTVRLQWRWLGIVGYQQRRWLKRAHDEKEPGPYLTLATAAANEGQSNDALRAKILASSRAANFLEKLLLGWVRYGYRSWLVVVPLLLLFVPTWALTSRLENRSGAFAPATVGTIQYYSPGSATAGGGNRICDAQAVTCLSPVLYAIDAILPVNQHQVSTWRVTENGGAATTLYWLVTVDGYASWVFAGVFLASAGGLLKRT